MLLFLLNASEDAVGFTAVSVLVVQSVVMIGSIFPTEAALKKNFDKDGNRKLTEPFASDN